MIDVVMVHRMRRFCLMVSMGCALLLVGCETAPEPSRQERLDSGQKAPVLDDRAVFFLVGSSQPIKLTSFSANGNSFDLKFDCAAPNFGALATAFTKDGYLLTAGHAAKAHMLVIGVMNGEVRAVSARVVYNKSFGTFGTDLAIIHVDQSIDFPLALGEFRPDQSEVFGLGADRESSFKIVVIGGKVRSSMRSKTSDQVVLLDTDLPSWHGDSGGGVVSRDGHLIGVITGFQTKWSALRNAKLVCAPSKDLIDSIVAKDRGTSPTAAAQAAAVH